LLKVLVLIVAILFTSIVNNPDWRTDETGFHGHGRK